MRAAALTAFALAAVLGTAAVGQDSQALSPTRSWAGRVADAGKEGLLKEAPTTGFVVEPKEFEKLWRAWRGDEMPPRVDFTREVVFVHTAKGPNMLKVTYTVDAAGDLKAMAASTLVAGPGFGYVIDVLPKAAFKTFRGKALARTD